MLDLFLFNTYSSKLLLYISSRLILVFVCSVFMTNISREGEAAVTQNVSLNPQQSLKQHETE